MRVVARFDPPGAQAAARDWRDQHAATLSALPAEAVRIDTGRAVGGDFVQVSVLDDYANRFEDPEERGARILFRAIFTPRWFADLIWRLWLRRKRRRERRTGG
jgi:hypothetical protein